MTSAAKRARGTLFFLLVLGLALAACKSGGNATSSQGAKTETGGPSSGTVGGDRGGTEASKDNIYSEVCRKYDLCGCQKYDDCMEQAANTPALEDASLRECLLKSSCESLCAARPDGCLGQAGGGGGGGATGPQRSNCAAIPCSKDTDCPTDCYGRCNGSVCLSF
jgi:hypothetical protein